jgi:4-amino-4-deoxy-L-arabinose transferase-like glycosyltransferase
VTRGRRAAALLLLAVALGLAALGQFYFFYRKDYLWDGLILHGLAILCFGLAWHISRLGGQKGFRDRAHPLSFGRWLRAQLGRTALMLSGVMLSLAATILSQSRSWNQSTWDVIILWLLGIISVTLAAVWPSPPRTRSHRDWRPRFDQISRETWLEVVTVAALTLLALILRVMALDRVPYTVGGDEAWHGLLARQVLSGELRNPFVMGYMSMPTSFYWPLSWSLRLVGNDATGLRFPAAVAGTITIPILYLFARRLWGKQIALLSALFLTAYDYHIHYSRLGANNIWDPLFVVLTLWLVDLGLTTTDRLKCSRLFTLAGLVMGLSVYYYTGARLLPILVATYVVFVWIKRNRSGNNREWPGSYIGPSLALATAFVVAAGPMLGYALSHPDDWNARINQVGIIQSGWLAREPGLTGKTLLQILAEQFLRAAGAFHAFPDRTAWYGADRPLLGIAAGGFSVLGMAWAFFHWRQRRHFLVLTWFWSVILTGGMLTESPPSSQRLVIAIPAVAILVALGLERSVALLLRLLRPGHRIWGSILAAALMAALMISAVGFYFVEYTPERRYGSANGETATMIAHHLRQLDGDSQAYLFGAPRLYWSFGTMNFLAPEIPGFDVLEPLGAAPDFVDRTQAAVFIFLPERAGELAWVAEAFPDGETREFYDTDGELRFIRHLWVPQ